MGQSDPSSHFSRFFPLSGARVRAQQIGPIVDPYFEARARASSTTTHIRVANRVGKQIPDQTRKQCLRRCRTKRDVLRPVGRCWRGVDSVECAPLNHSQPRTRGKPQPSSRMFSVCICNHVVLMCSSCDTSQFTGAVGLRHLRICIFKMVSIHVAQPQQHAQACESRKWDQGPLGATLHGPQTDRLNSLEK